MLLGLIISISFKSNSDNLDKVKLINASNTMSQHVFSMRDAVHRRSLLLYRIVVETDSFKRDEMWMEYKKEAQSYLNASQLLKGKISDEDVREELGDTLVFSGRSSKLQNRAVDLILDEKKDEAYALVVNEIIPVQDEIMNRLTDLLISVRVNVDDHITSLNDENKNSNLIISLLGAAAFIFGSIIAILVTRKIGNTEESMLFQSQLAERESAAKSLFLANMSHEIRSPLTAIIGFSRSMLGKKLAYDKQQEYISNIVRNSEHLIQIVNDILDISKIEAGQLDIEIIDCSLSKIMSDLESIVGVPAKEKGLDFNVNYSFPLPDNIQTDPTRLKQILVNLANNAMKFTEKGRIDIHVSFSAKRNKIQFSVADTGIGMTEEQLEKIFKPFTQADSSISRNFGGTGLGLNISSQLANKLGGELTCISQIGCGSHFSFSIDCGDTNENEWIRDKEKFVHKDSTNDFTFLPTLTGKVLLAEDTIDNQHLIEMYVTDIGASISIVDNGLEALKSANEESFDLILMDMQMPVMGGIESTEKIRASGNNTPIVSLTANVMKSDIDKCISAGANDFLTKPIDVNKFGNILKKYLSESKEGIKKPAPKKDRLKSITRRFIQDLPDRMKRINIAFDNEDWPELEIESHKLKSLGSSMGYPSLTKLSTEINDSCIEKKYADIKKLQDMLNTDVTGILEGFTG